MSRGLSGVLLSAFDQDHIVTVVLVKLEFDVADGGTQFYHTGAGNLDYLGETYTGVGDFGKIEPITEDKGIKMKGITLAFQGIDTTVIFHPSYLLRNPSPEAGKPKWITWQDLKAIKSALV